MDVHVPRSIMEVQEIELEQLREGLYVSKCRVLPAQRLLQALHIMWRQVSCEGVQAVDGREVT